MIYARLFRQSVMASAFVLISGATLSLAQNTVTSPDGSVEARVAINDAGRPVISARLENQPALERGPLGITVDGTDLGNGVTMNETNTYTWDRNTQQAENLIGDANNDGVVNGEDLPAVKQNFGDSGPGDGSRHGDADANGSVNGDDLTAVKQNFGEALEDGEQARGLTIKLEHQATDQPWTIDVRAYNTGIAWRYVVPGEGTRTVNGETSSFHLPNGTTLWYQTNTNNYENSYQSTQLTENASPINSAIGPPATGVLPDGAGYVCLAESNILHYSGMTLNPTGPTTLQAAFEDDPNGWAMEGKITSPWRVAMVTSNLNELVNSNLVARLAPAPDEELFPKGTDTEWIDPGRSWWTWYVYDDAGAAWNRQKPFVDEAAALNCDFHLVDAGWEGGEQWNAGERSKWDRLEELCDYAAQKDVGIWVWTAAIEGISGRASAGLETKAKRERFFRKLDQAGAVGVKIDYFNGESHKKLAIMEGCLRQAAKHQIMINFHGVASPKGEARTWPNEMTREGVRAMEHNKWDQSTLEHWTALPFTRFVVGHGDITPGIVPEADLRNLTAATQMAMATIYTSPYLCWAGVYEDYQQSNITDFVKHLPTTWDQTRVLPSSEIGRRAVIARRKGKQWYLAAIEGGTDWGEPLYESDVVTGSDGPKRIEVGLNGADRLALRTTTTSDGYQFDHTNWSEATLVTESGRTVRLSSLDPASSSQGWGSLKENKSITGGELRIGEQTYDHGLGTHADSTVVYELNRDYTRFRAAIGIDEQAEAKGSARFLVHTTDSEQTTIQPELGFLGDGQYRAKLIENGDERGTFDVRQRHDLTRQSELVLPVKEGGGFVIKFTPE